MTSAFELKPLWKRNILKIKYYCSLNMDRENGRDRQTDEGFIIQVIYVHVLSYIGILFSV